MIFRANFALRKLSQQLALAQKAEEEVQEAKSRVKAYQDVELRMLLPDQVHQWCTSPFKNQCSPPVDVKLFEPLPSYGKVLGILTTQHLEAVRTPHTVASRRPLA